MKAIRDKVISFIIGKVGTVVATMLAGFVSWLIITLLHLVQFKLAAFSPMLAKMLTEQIQGLDQGKLVVELWLGFVCVMNYVTNHYLTTFMKPVQETLVRLGYDLKIDGWAGDSTVGALVKETGLPVLPAIPVEPPKP